MAFRSNEYLQRNELVRFQLDDVIRAPANGQHQTKNGYKFTINDRSAFYDWYNGYLEVQFQLQKTADAAGYAAADRITTINGSHSLIKHLTIRSAGKIIYDTDNLHKVCFVKNLLEYSDDFSSQSPRTVSGIWIPMQQPPTRMPDLKLGGCKLKRFKTMEAAVQRTSM